MAKEEKMAIPYKLRVVYVGQLNEDMDNRFITLAEGYGYDLSTGGYDVKTKQRELNFELRE